MKLVEMGIGQTRASQTSLWKFHKSGKHKEALRGKHEKSKSVRVGLTRAFRSIRTTYRNRMNF